MIDVHNVSKVFRDRRNTIHAVKNITFQCRPGEVFGLLGPNGAGKTTLLRIIASSLSPTSGSVVVDGFNTQTHSADVRQRLGFISSNTALYGRLTGTEILLYFGQLNGMSKRQIHARIEELNHEFDFSDALNRSLDKCSTGMKQKINIARTVLHQPPVVILDEPTAGLDVIASQSILTFIEKSRAEGKTILLSTHIMREVERLCDRAAIIHQGELKFNGTRSELLAEKRDCEELEDSFLRFLGMSKHHEASSL